MNKKINIQCIDYESVLKCFAVAVFVLVSLSLICPHSWPTIRHYNTWALAQIENFHIAVDAFENDTKQYPQTLDDLLHSPGLVNWRGPYLDQLKSIPDDPWGKPYQYMRNGPDKFTIMSAGNDGIFNTEDDISVRPERQ
jgi:hypothetical protein